MQGFASSKARSCVLAGSLFGIRPWAGWARPGLGVQGLRFSKGCGVSDLAVYLNTACLFSHLGVLLRAQSQPPVLKLIPRPPPTPGGVALAGSTRASLASDSERTAFLNCGRHFRCHSRCIGQYLEILLRKMLDEVQTPVVQ